LAYHSRRIAVDEVIYARAPRLADNDAVRGARSSWLFIAKAEQLKRGEGRHAHYVRKGNAI